MNTQLRKEVSLVSARQAPLVVALIGALSLGFATTSIAVLVPVTSCLDDGSSGTLRHAVLIASTGDTLDMSGLSCSTITLQSGEIHVDVDPLTIQGPGAVALTIDGNNADRIFYHSLTNTLTLIGVTLAHGKTTGANAIGGCVYSKGSVALRNSTVTGCSAVATGYAFGGGVFAKNNIALYSSAITDNVANATGPAAKIGAAGGGVLAQTQQLYMSGSVLSGNTSEAPNGKGRGGGGASAYEINVHYSTITGNKAVGKSAVGYYGVGGGLYGGNQSYTYIGDSTIDHNQADIGGGLLLLGSGTAVVTDSTISSNVANIGAAGFAAENSVLMLSHTTIAFNTAGAAGAAGLFVTGGADLENSILADNSPSGTAGGADLAAAVGATITGNHNVIKVSSAAALANTITSDPALGPLACNGGPTRTHALPLSSPAIDAGGLIAGINHDQRGRGFARNVGAAPDLGAYERNPDQIFADGFDCM